MAFYTKEVIAALDLIHPDKLNGNEVERLQVRAAARRLLSRLETPYERAWGFSFEHPGVFAALQTFIDVSLWESWTAVGGGRFFRLLAAFNVVEETREDRFKPTLFSLAIGDESTKVRAALQGGTYQFIPAGHNLSKYLAKISYREPTDAKANNYSDSDPDGLNFFGRLQRSPAHYETFTGYMEGWTAWKTPWTTVYNTEKLLEDANISASSPLVVDVGGNTGIDLSYVLAKHPDLPAGSLVLQDLPEVIANVKVDKRIKAMTHDFFFPQPVQGSRAYFMHAVLHDWPDDKAKQLLSNTRDAMVKGYSKLFIYEVVLPPTGASVSQATMDVGMMSLLSASERTQSAWERLLGDAGLKIIKIWPDPQECEMLIEAEVA
ncbi:hypothetical protein DTO282F9_2702 [Paecilomyces variotii]|nr:hypothetical protein DTO282F9_2702 [Paecilomyces variotii]